MLDTSTTMILWYAVTAAVWFLAYAAGLLTMERKHRRENSATAQCAACDWKSDPVPLAEAFRAAGAHTATPAATATDRHRGFVVKA